MFSDPYDILAKLASKAAKKPLPMMQGGDQKNIAPLSSGEAFRDPFDPDFRFNSKKEDVESNDMNLAQGGGAAKAEHQAAKAEQMQAAADPNAMPFADTMGNAADPADKPAEHPAKNGGKAGAPATDGAEATLVAEAVQIKSELADSVKKAGLAKLPGIDIQATAEGVLISLTDEANFEMFALSSAEPRPELVVLMEDLGKTLAKTKGEIIIRGHTDARPFRSKTYDNWRLSTARAHIAHYMLLRGGLPKDRIERIEGYADRDLKDPKDPFAAQNRRIEILLKPEKA